MPKQKYFDTMTLLMMLIVGSSLFFFGLMAFYWIDSLFFNEQVMHFLRTKHNRLFGGSILIVVFGSGGLAMYLGTRTNFEWSDAYIEKLDSVITDEDDRDELGATGAYVDKTKSLARQFAEEDEGFSALYKRFSSYLYSTSGNGIPSRNMAVDINSGGRIGMFVHVYTLGLLVVPFILVVAFMMHYVEKIYSLEMGEAVAAVRHISPFRFYVGLILCLSGVAYLMFNFVNSLRKNIFGFVNDISAAVLDTAPPDTLDSMYQTFLNHKYMYINVPWSVLIYQSIIGLAFVPVVFGFVLFNAVLILSGLVPIIIAYSLMQLNNGEGDAFKVSAEGWVRYMPTKGKPVDFSLNDCEEVIVRYQSNQSNSVRISSTTAMMRDLARGAINKILDIPELIPSVIIFHLKDKEPVLVPLRFICDSNEQSVDSHQIEFLFALWLKERGFSFELQQTDEDAGDWRVYRA